MMWEKARQDESSGEPEKKEIIVIGYIMLKYHYELKLYIGQILCESFY